MCGIVGYTGERQAVGVLLDGLAQLEYRGYDSTGICLAGADGFTRVRADDNLAALRTLVDVAPDSPAPAGIGHTRWATHGEVSVSNTHPFVGCDTGFAVVLNGIIENFTELRDELVDRGHRFESSTDAEVVVHLLEEHAHLEPEDAMARATGHLEGHFAIVALDRRRPGVLIGTRTRSPWWRASARASSSWPRPSTPCWPRPAGSCSWRTVTWSSSTGPEWTAYDCDGRVVDREEITVVRSTTRADHEGHGSFLAKEIDEQPGAVSDTLLGRITGTTVHLAELDDRPGDAADQSFTDRVADFDHLVVVGCGTALHAGQVARPMFERWTSLRTEVAVASEWRYAAPIVDDDHPGRRHLPVRRDGGHPGGRPPGPLPRGHHRRHHQHARLAAHPGGRPGRCSPGPAWR